MGRVSLLIGRVDANPDRSHVYYCAKTQESLGPDNSPVAILGSGDIFGEISLLAHSRRTATVRRRPLEDRELARRPFLCLHRDQ